MANEEQHIAAANRTQNTIGHLLPHIDVTSPWVATTAFYKALHIVEAVFSNDRSIGNTADHGSRERKLKSVRKYENIVRNYMPLSRASIVARYLSSHPIFDEYLCPQDVVSQLLLHHLHQVESSAQRFLSNPEELLRISDCPNI